MPPFLVAGFNCLLVNGFTDLSPAKAPQYWFFAAGDSERMVVLLMASGEQSRIKRFHALLPDFIGLPVAGLTVGSSKKF